MKSTAAPAQTATHDGRRWACSATQISDRGAPKQKNASFGFMRPEPVDHVPRDHGVLLEAIGAEAVDLDAGVPRAQRLDGRLVHLRRAADDGDGEAEHRRLAAELGHEVGAGDAVAELVAGQPPDGDDRRAVGDADRGGGVGPLEPHVALQFDHVIDVGRHHVGELVEVGEAEEVIDRRGEICPRRDRRRTP